MKGPGISLHSPVGHKFLEALLNEDFEAHDGDTKGVRLAYIHEDETGYMAIFYAPAEVFDKWRDGRRLLHRIVRDRRLLGCRRDVETVMASELPSSLMRNRYNGGVETAYTA